MMTEQVEKLDPEALAQAILENARVIQEEQDRSAEEIDRNDLPTIVKVLREKLGLTQEQLAATLEVSFSTINRWEHGKVQPSSHLRKEILKAAELAGVFGKDSENLGSLLDRVDCLGLLSEELHDLIGELSIRNREIILRAVLAER